MAYTEGGLLMVVMVSPKLIFHIADIPGAELAPTSRTFIPTVVQTAHTASIMVPEAVAYALQVLAGPTHTGLLNGVMQADANQLAENRRLGVALAQVRQALGVGRVDNVGVLDQLRDSLLRNEWPDADLGRFAETVMQEIQRRRTLVLQRYRRETRANHQLLEIFRQFDREAF